ncbi:DUF6371 domain-containing protein [Sphingobacterium humi]|uniref:Uncharacterized protein n=1 Tax=Sphingobacterium humi TaxID=1796905 RepID=A0A6N8KZI0_9SPHI|nr:DUF6371 domain-containing protein [Sphingobacterium humi]MVZ62139.1 hypothetical protein [Sphingobacterium humi]
MSDYKYHLEPYKGMNTRHRCPSCGAKGKFAMYIDVDTKEYIGDSVGKCERIDSCGHHYTPKQYFEDNGIHQDPKPYFSQRPVKRVKIAPTFIDRKIMEHSFNAYEKNNFVEFLDDRFGTDVTIAVIVKYMIGSSKLWEGSTVFWQVDKHKNVRTGKIMLYSRSNGKRVRKPFDHIQWAHKALKLDNFNLEQCFFGEHLLAGSSKPVAIVESEKSAIICSIYFRQFIWIASGSAQGLNKSKCEVLSNREVILFPDLKVATAWQEKANELKSIAKFSVSTFLEDNASKEELEQGLDIADYLLRFEPSEFSESIRAGKTEVSDEQSLKSFFLELAQHIPIGETVAIDDLEIKDFRKYIIDASDNPLAKEFEARTIYRIMHMQGYSEFENKY